MKKRKTVLSTTGFLLLLNLINPSYAASQNEKQQPSNISPELWEERVTLQSLTHEQGQARINAIPFTKSEAVFPRYCGINYIAVEFMGDSPEQTKLLADDLIALGTKQVQREKNLISGCLNRDHIQKISTLNALRFARRALRPLVKVGSVDSQADMAMGSDIASSTYGLNGSGSKIGVLSDSYDNTMGAEDGINSGDLPNNIQVLSDLDQNGSDEGRAMLELIHDIAPGADLAFHTAFKGKVDFAAGIRALADAGCNIIVDDIVYFSEPFFQEGVIAQAVNEVVERGVSYFSSAGNVSEQSYQSSYVSAGYEPFGAGTGVAQNFADGDITQTIRVGSNSALRLALQWDDPFLSAGSRSGAKTDVDMYLLYDGEVLFSSTNSNIGNDPFEFIGIVNNGSVSAEVEIVIVHKAGPAPGLLKWINYASAEYVEYDTQSPTIIGHANARHSIAVGAAAYFNTPVFNANIATAMINGFSSRGGVPLIFRKNGERKKAPVTFRKPEIVAPDGTNTSFFGGPDVEVDGFPNFFGTSAAAPHAAAVAALLNQATNNSLSPEDIKRVLKDTAIDMDDPLTQGFDNKFDFKTGWGFIDANNAIMTVLQSN